MWNQIIQKSHDNTELLVKLSKNLLPFPNHVLILIENVMRCVNKDAKKI